MKTIKNQAPRIPEIQTSNRRLSLGLLACGQGQTHQHVLLDGCGRMVATQIQPYDNACNTVAGLDGRGLSPTIGRVRNRLTQFLIANIIGESNDRFNLRVRIH